MSKEIWRPIKGYEDLYEVSNYGRVRSLDRIVYQIQNGGKLGPTLYKGRILGMGSSGGYKSCGLWKDGTVKTFPIHRLVAETFIPNPNNYPCVNHKDENKVNNHVENLEWCTYEYNNNYGTKCKRAAINHPKCKRVRVDGAEYHSIHEAARFLGCKSPALSNALNRNQTTYKNHKIELIN